jgi:mannitol-1-/sugar-/sorbitol-6-phosphatase
MPRLACCAVLFDLDGVLVDSTPCVTRVWTAWANQHGLDPDYVVHVAHGQKAIETVRKVAPQLNAEREFHIIEHMELDDTDGLRVLPGARELLAALSPERYTIVTSGTRRLATKRLQVVGLPVPANMVTADEVARGKPNPEPYLAGAAVVGFAAGDCLVFEDAPSGIRSAQAAGAQVVAVATTYKREELTAALVAPTRSKNANEWGTRAIIPSLAAVQTRGFDGSGRIRVEIAAAEHAVRR